MYDPRFSSVDELGWRVLFGGYATVGALIVARDRGNRIGWVCCAVGLLVGPAAFAQAMAGYGLVYRPGSLPMWLALGFGWLGSWPWYPAMVAIGVLLPLLFPTGRLPSRRWRLVAWAAAMTVTASTLLAAFAPRTLELPADRLMFHNPLGIGSGVDVFDAVAPFIAAAVAILAVLSAASVVLRFRRSAGDERLQLKWFTYGVGISTIPLVLTIVTNLDNRPGLAALLLGLGGILAVPAAIGVAVLRYRLYAIDLIVNRSLVYAALTMAVAGAYVLIVGYLGATFQAQSSVGVSLAATGVVAVVFAPLRDRLQRAANRLLYGDRDRPAVVLSRLGHQLETTLATDQILPSAVRTVAAALKLPYVAVDIYCDGALQTAAAIGTRQEGLHRLPLMYGGEPVGELTVGVRVGQDAFGLADLRSFTELAHPLGAAVNAVRLAQTAARLSKDLQQSRQRLVTTREEERRRLRRDLHDGLGPTLASVAMLAEAARDSISTDPNGARRLLDDLIEQSQGATTEVRRLVAGLRPPSLDTLGPVGALHAQTARYIGPGPTITVTAPDDLPPLPAAVEVAIYWIAVEAITNVRRHADATTCSVQITYDAPGQTINLDVRDDGRGLEPSRQHATGMGLASMRERASELGGTCTIVTSSRGTSLTATIPCPTDAAQDITGASSTSRP